MTIVSLARFCKLDARYINERLRQMTALPTAPELGVFTLREKDTAIETLRNIAETVVRERLAADMAWATTQPRKPFGLLAAFCPLNGFDDTK